MNKHHFFIEYEWQKYDESQIPPLFFERGFCEKSANGAIKFKVTGLIEYKKHFYSIFPKGMTIPYYKGEKALITQLLFKTLTKYSSTNLSEEEASWMGNNKSTQIFDIVGMLIEDYKQYGLIRSNKRIKQINGNGRIEWSKTIQKQTPFIIKNKLHYLDVITSKNDIVSDQELTIIHSLLLKRVSEHYGWLFNFQFNNDFSGDFPEKYMLYSLKKALRSTNINREIRLFKNLIAFLDGRNNSNLINIYATAHFANIWEAACKNFIGDTKELHKMVPNPYWIYKGKKKYTSQIPDILVNIENDIVVFDAKYYQIEKGVDKLPGWGDIVKQLFYAMSLKESSRKVYNAFLFPSNCTLGYEYLGYTSVENKENDFGKIFAFGLDVQMILKSFVDEGMNPSSTKFVNKLFEDIKRLQHQDIS